MRGKSAAKKRRGFMVVGLSKYRWHKQADIWTMAIPVNCRTEIYGPRYRIVDALYTRFCIWDLARASKASACRRPTNLVYRLATVHSYCCVLDTSVGDTRSTKH